METKLVNRENEQGLLKQWFADDNQGTIVFLAAPSGVGKSIFTQHLCQSAFYERVCIRVSCSAVTDDLKPEWFLTRELAATLNRLSRNVDMVIGINEYLTSLSSTKTKKRYNTSLLKGLKKDNPIATIYERHSGVGEFDVEKKLDPCLTADVQDVKDYVEFTLSQLQLHTASSLLVVENIQVCDEYSLKFLSELIYDQQELGVIFEYTVSNEKRNCFHIDNLRSFFSLSESRFKHLDLGKLDNHSIKLLLQLWQVSESMSEILLSAYEHTLGNIRKLEDFKSIFHSQHKHDLDMLELEESKMNILMDAVYKDVFSGLDHSAAFLLVLLSSVSIELHKAVISEVFILATEKGFCLDLDLAVSSLKNRGGLIKVRDNGNIVLAHDSLSRAFASLKPFKEKSLVVKNLITTVFEEFIGQNKFDFVSRFDCLFVLVNIYSNENSTKLISLLEHFKITQMQERAPEAAKHFLQKLRDMVLCNKYVFKDSNFFALMRVYYELDMFELGLELSGHYVDQSAHPLLLYKAATLNRLSKNEDAILICKRVLQDHRISKDSSTYIRTLVLLMVCYRSLNRIENAKKVFLKLDRLGERFHSEDSYGVFLRNAQMVLTLPESIKYLNKCITHYQNLDNRPETGKGFLALAMQYTRLDNLDAAEATIQKAYHYLKDRNIDLCKLLNNHAVLEAYKGQYSSALEKLYRAKSLAISLFDKVVITYNLLAVLSLENKNTELNHYIPYLENLINENQNKRYNSVKRSTYFNLSVIFEISFKDSIAAARYLDKAKKVQAPLNEYWEARLYGKPSNVRPLKTPYHLGFLSHWSINVV